MNRDKEQQSETNKKRKAENKPIKLEPKLVCLCVLLGIVLYYINKKNKDCVMEICLVLWQPCSHDNCCAG